MESVEKISLLELLSDDKYKNFSLSELQPVINENLEYSDYLKLKGKYSHQKAKILYREWRSGSFRVVANVRRCISVADYEVQNYQNSKNLNTRTNGWNRR